MLKSGYIADVLKSGYIAAVLHHAANIFSATGVFEPCYNMQQLCFQRLASLRFALIQVPAVVDLASLLIHHPPARHVSLTARR